MLPRSVLSMLNVLGIVLLPYLQMYNYVQTFDRSPSLNENNYTFAYVYIIFSL